MNSLQLMPRQNESKVRNLCINLGWFSETEHAQEQQNSVAYGQKNSLTGASRRFVSFKHIFTKCNILCINQFYYFPSKFPSMP